MRITCLHTARSNIDVFEAAADGLDATLSHVVRPDLLSAAEAAGGLTDGIAAEVAMAIAAITIDADAVVLTCSTLGPVVERFAAMPVPVLRADAALAAAAVAAAGASTIVALCAVETTLRPTSRLFEAAAGHARPSPAIEVRLVEHAWSLFKAGRNDDYLMTVAAAADAAFAGGAAVVALAQVSMTGAAARTMAGTPLTSPRAALVSARDMVGYLG